MSERKNKISYIKVIKVFIASLLFVGCMVLFKSCQSIKEPELDFSWVNDLFNIDPIMGYKDEEVVDILIGENRETKELKVMEQDFEDVHEVTSAFLNLDIFRKTQKIHYFGTATYTVDLNEISEDDIIINKEDKTIIIVIPHAEMDQMSVDYEKTIIEEVDRELLGWGDISMTMEQFNVLQKNMQSSLETAAKEKQFYDEADKKAKDAVFNIYKQALSNLNPEYTINVVFDSPLDSEK